MVQESWPMPTLARFLFRFARLLFSGHAAVAAENAALRLQLAAFQRQRRRPLLTSLDRMFWVGLSLLWKRWRSPLMYVQADTVVRWQRERFRRFWAHLSRGNRRRRGRPSFDEPNRLLRFQRTAVNDPGAVCQWMLGFDLSSFDGQPERDAAHLQLMRSLG